MLAIRIHEVLEHAEPYQVRRAPLLTRQMLNGSFATICAVSSAFIDGLTNRLLKHQQHIRCFHSNADLGLLDLNGR